MTSQKQNEIMADIKDLLAAFEYMAESHLGHTLKAVTKPDEIALETFQKLKEKYGVHPPQAAH